MRVADNSALLQAAAESDEVIACFIFDPAILERFRGHERRLLFLVQSIEDLDRQVTECGGSLRIFNGNPVDVVEQLFQQKRIDAVYINRDYTPFARRRDSALKRACERYGGRLSVSADALLNEPEAVLKSDGTPYVVFTPYHRAALAHKINQPEYERPANLAGINVPGYSLAEADVPQPPVTSPIIGGRDRAIDILRHIDALEDYEEDRDYPARSGTSRLSAHLKFGTCSVREAHHQISGALGTSHPLLRQLHWRDFFTQVGFHFPHVFGHAFRRQYDAIPWTGTDEAFDSWCRGETGFPIVDAAMHELIATGYMHNRARMIVASFLVKNLHVDWRAGEAVFAKHLIDYDPAVNNGNWQWAASTGCDAQPYFRVFNPWRQQRRFDPDASYIKTWLPALAEWSATDIHGLEKHPSGYLPQIVDLKTSAAEIKERFKQASR